jgi:hypothetical protein
VQSRSEVRIPSRRSTIRRTSASELEDQMSVDERQAPELRVQRWIGVDGRKHGRAAQAVGSRHRPERSSSPSSTGAVAAICMDFRRYKVLHGALSAKGVGFAVIQTVFEGADENTFEKLRVNQLKYALPVAFGHDEPPAGATLPTFMEDYRTRGTPWFSVMDAGGRIAILGLPSRRRSAREGTGAGVTDAALGHPDCQPSRRCSPWASRAVSTRCRS